MIEGAVMTKRESDLEAEIDLARNAIKEVHEIVQGIPYDECASLPDATKTMADMLITAIKERDAQIQKLYLKLGQLVAQA